MLDELLKDMKKFARKNDLPIVDYFGEEKGGFLERLVKEHKPKNILEIGTLIGYSTILMARNTKGKITTIEINEKIANIAKENIEKAGFSNVVKILVGNAIEILPKINEKFEFVFIDASKEEYIDYLKLIENKLENRAVIVADNAKIFAESMEDYLDYVRNSGKYNSKFYDFGHDGMEVSVKV